MRSAEQQQTDHQARKKVRSQQWPAATNSSHQRSTPEKYGLRKPSTHFLNQNGTANNFAPYRGSSDQYFDHARHGAAMRHSPHFDLRCPVLQTLGNFRKLRDHLQNIISIKSKAYHHQRSFPS
jgi:hypothetical protein